MALVHKKEVGKQQQAIKIWRGITRFETGTHRRLSPGDYCKNMYKEHLLTYIIWTICSPGRNTNYHCSKIWLKSDLTFEQAGYHGSCKCLNEYVTKGLISVKPCTESGCWGTQVQSRKVLLLPEYWWSNHWKDLHIFYLFRPAGVLAWCPL